MSTNCRRFVGLGEDPQVLAIRAPELFAVSEMSHSPFVADDLVLVQMIASTYPQVKLGVSRV